MAYDASGAPPDRSGLNKRASSAKERSEALFKAQRNWLHYWQDLADIFYPEMADFVGERADGRDPYDGLFTSRMQIYRRTLAERIGSMTRTKGEEWFKLVAKPKELNDRDDVKRWCDDSSRRQRNILYNGMSGFAVAMQLADNDYATFGLAITAFAYNQKKDGLYFRACHLRDCAIAQSIEGVVNEVHERIKMPLKDAAAMFGKDNLPHEWQDKLKDDKMRHESIEVRRCVMPLEGYDYEGERRRPPKDSKFVSIYYACGVSDSDIGLAEGFFKVFPYAVRRWMRMPGQVYSRSPAASVALADGRSLNIAEAALLKGIELKVSPPRAAVDDGIVGDIRLEADAVTFIDRTFMESGEDPIKSLEVGDPRYGMEYVDRKSVDMAKAFFMDLLQLPDRAMTLGEFRQRFRNALRDAAPVFEPIEAEYAMMMEGVFYLSMDVGGPAQPYGAFLEPPEVLTDVDFEFQTALSEAFTDLEREEAMAVLEQYARLVELGSEEVDHIDLGRVTRDSMGNMRPEWTRPEDQVAARREQRMQQQAEQQQKAEMMAIAEARLKAKPENVEALKRDMEEAQ